MKAIKVIAAILAAALVFVLVLFVGGLFQRLLITGAQMAQDWGDTVILTDDAEVGEGNASYAPDYDAPVATWPPGDDPSWSEDMPLAPVDQTADELAEEMKK